MLSPDKHVSTFKKTKNKHSLRSMPAICVPGQDTMKTQFLTALPYFRLCYIEEKQLPALEPIVGVRHKS